MKTIKKIHRLAWVGLSILLTACEAESLEINKPPPKNPEFQLTGIQDEVGRQISSNIFDFDLHIQDCPGGGQSISVFMPSSEDFAYEWMVDGHYAGSGAALFCSTGNTAIIKAVRRADGLTRTKTVHLFNTSGVKAEVSAFDVNLVVSPCFATGATVQARTPAAVENYAFLWEVDYQPAGHYYKLNCICGELIKVKVTRFSDGASVTRSISLHPSCYPDD